MLSCRCLVECWPVRVCRDESRLAALPRRQPACYLTDFQRRSRQASAPPPPWNRQGDHPPRARANLPTLVFSPFHKLGSRARVLMKRLNLRILRMPYLLSYFRRLGAVRAESPWGIWRPRCLAFALTPLVTACWTYVRPRARNPVRRWPQTGPDGSSSGRAPSFTRRRKLARCQVAPEDTVVSVWEGVLEAWWTGCYGLLLGGWECGSRSNAYMRAEHGKLTRGTWNFILCLRVSPDDCFHANPWDEYSSA
jgi:hypothetical protein